MILFNRPGLAGNEFAYMKAALAAGHLSGNGPMTKACHAWLEARVGCAKALLTHSCTAALEMAAVLLDLGPGDEVVMPSFAFVTTANAFVLRGATPVFVDIQSDTMNVAPACIEAAITKSTKAIVALHYAGVACDMGRISALAVEHGLKIVEDAAQGVLASHRGTPLGAIGHLGAYSFHETKNVSSGEGGALLVNDARLVERAEIVWEKGTNRNQFFRGQVDKYTWVDIGSSYLPSEIIAAFLLAQLEQADRLTETRLRIWQRYHDAFEELEEARLLRRPCIPPYCTHNGHIYYVLVKDLAARTAFLSDLHAHGVGAVFHYVPLHSSPAGRRFGRCGGDLSTTDDVSNRLVRLPLWTDMTDAQQSTVIRVVIEAARRLQATT